MYLGRAFFDSKVIKHYLKSSINPREEYGKGTMKQHFGCIFSMEPCTDSLVPVPETYWPAELKEDQTSGLSVGKGGLWDKLQISQRCL